MRWLSLSDFCEFQTMLHPHCGQQFRWRWCCLARPMSVDTWVILWQMHIVIIPSWFGQSQPLLSVLDFTNELAFYSESNGLFVPPAKERSYPVVSPLKLSFNLESRIIEDNSYKIWCLFGKSTCTYQSGVRNPRPVGFNFQPFFVHTDTVCSLVKLFLLHSYTLIASLFY